MKLFFSSFDSCALLFQRALLYRHRALLVIDRHASPGAIVGTIFSNQVALQIKVQGLQHS